MERRNASFPSIQGDIFLLWDQQSEIQRYLISLSRATKRSIKPSQWSRCFFKKNRKWRFSFSNCLSALLSKMIFIQWIQINTYSDKVFLIVHHLPETCIYWITMPQIHTPNTPVTIHSTHTHTLISAIHLCEWLIKWLIHRSMEECYWLCIILHQSFSSGFSFITSLGSAAIEQFRHQLTGWGVARGKVQREGIYKSNHHKWRS